MVKKLRVSRWEEDLGGHRVSSRVHTRQAGRLEMHGERCEDGPELVGRTRSRVKKVAASRSRKTEGNRFSPRAWKGAQPH